MNRRQFLKTTLAIGIGGNLYPLRNLSKASPKGKKVIVLGIDGMDTNLTRVYMEKGLLPNIKKVARTGSLNVMTTSTPPQSPVAWSNVAIGAPSKIHGIYDFIHRDPSRRTPYLSTSRVSSTARTIPIGGYNLPLAKERTELLRNGKPFWEYLAEKDIPVTIFKMPANFPCKSGRVDMVSGMGTPDLRGGYGNFTFITSDPEYLNRECTGGIVIPVTFRNEYFRTDLPGPINSFKKRKPESRVPLEIWRDPANSVIRIVIDSHELLLRKGEWSDWIQVSFPMIGSIVEAKGILKLLIKQVHPHFSMYISPINIDPSDPALPIISSKKYGELLTEKNGLFYTQGFPDDTKALSEGFLNEEEYLDLANQIIREREGLMDFELNRFSRIDTGMLFFYYSSIDQNSHMYWRAIDSHHPLYDAELNKKYGRTLRQFYTQIDTYIGKIINSYDIDDPAFSLMIMSDHGFSPFRREVNLNNWLYEAGFMKLKNPKHIEDPGYFGNVDWPQTAAYNVGINSIYLNIEGREKTGSVPNGMAEGLRKKIKRELMKLSDRQKGENAVSRVWIVPEAERRHNRHAPDIIVGWNYGYRTSWRSILGGFADRVFMNNIDKWSGDHCVDPSLVPAVLIMNKSIAKSNPTLCDIAPSIISEFNIPPGDNMTGTRLYQM